MVMHGRFVMFVQGCNESTAVVFAEDTFNGARESQLESREQASSIQPADEVCMGFRIFPVEIGAACQVMLISN